MSSLNQSKRKGQVEVKEEVVLELTASDLVCVPCVQLGLDELCAENRFLGPMAQPWSVEGWWSVVFFTSFHYCRFCQEFLRLFLLSCLRALYH